MAFHFLLRLVAFLPRRTVKPRPVAGVQTTLEKFFPLALVALSRALRRHEPTVLYSHLSTASWWCGWLEQMAGPPSVGHVHGFTRAVWHRRQRLLVAVSLAVKEHLVGQGIEPDRIRVLHNPVDPDDVTPTRSPRAARYATVSSTVSAPEPITTITCSASGAPT